MNPDPASVGLRADGYDVEVRLRRPAAELPAILASPTFAIVPPGVGRDDDALQAGAGFVASGAYRLVDSPATSWRSKPTSTTGPGRRRSPTSGS